MLEKVNYKDRCRVTELFEFVNSREDYDFYYFSDNSKNYVTDIPSLKKFLRLSVCNYAYSDKGYYKGLILVVKDIVAGQKKFYIKMNAINYKVALDLLTMVLWNFNTDLYVKVKRNSRYIDVLKYKGFRFLDEKGNQILLERKATPKEQIRIYRKEGDD